MIRFLMNLIRPQPRVSPDVIRAVLATTYDRNDRRNWMGY